jgi:Zn-dependent M16 (insulinase) family peptidase
MKGGFIKMEFDLEKQIEKLKKLDAYDFLKRTDMEELHACGVTMEHRKTGARVFLLLSDDRNKVFTIGFRTPPENSTGVAHIVEHTVLCGSEKFPSKDPFVELVKGSLNTFLNAMTYPDKTVYPVASCNDRDFKNLMDVYLDAVFHPNIYREEKIFRQDGWRYEMEDEKAPLTLNGVVYNEMKGAYSNADDFMEHEIMKVLYENHPYAEDSGGDPEVIPELTYEQYLDFHRKYYHPSNSYIYLYGNLDMAEALSWMDRSYLSAYDRQPVDSVIPDAKPFQGPVTKDFDYSISESETGEKATYLSLNMLAGCELDPLEYMGMQILDYVLLEVPGAYLHDALIDAGIGEDVYGGFNYGLRVPYFNITAKNTEAERKGEFLAVIDGTLRKLSDSGIDRDKLLAAINVSEFRAREADFGNTPKGLMYGLESFNSWLYDADPCMHLKFAGLFDELKKKTDEGFFEKLIEKYLLDNPSAAVITFHPVRGLNAGKDEKIRKHLAEIKSGMSAEEIREIVRKTKDLKAYENEPSKKEDLLKIPLLSRSDIDREAEKPVWEKRTLNGIPVIYSNVFTSGITYLKVIFDCSFLPAEDLPFLSFLKEVMGYIDTEKRNYAGLATAINLNSGGIGFSTDSYTDYSAEDRTVFTFSADAKVLSPKTGFAFDMIKEILLSSKLSDTKRIKDILSEIRSGLKDRLSSSGHVAALNRAASSCSEDAFFADATKGIAYYEALEKAAVNYDGNPDALAEKLISLQKKIFTRDNMLFHITSDEAGYRAFAAAEEGFDEAFPPHAERKNEFEFSEQDIREGWTTSSRVNHVARYGNFKKHGFEYTGVMRILKVLLQYDYLWNNIRVLGGAYGCASRFGRNGDAGLVSFRDPNLTETDKIYDRTAEYAASYQADEREMTKAIIGAISELDTPQTPLTKGLRGLSAYFSHVTEEELQKERDQILDAGPQDIRALSKLLEAVLSDEQKCTIGSENAIRKEKDLFTSVKPLFNL